MLIQNKQKIQYHSFLSKNVLTRDHLNACTIICSRECFCTDLSDFSEEFLRTCGMGFAFLERSST